ncbi:MAG: acyltransferase [Leptospira sp.]|nr:acyltransferase [Leptospira sp.]NCS94037.1 acyltransferase [Leptospira sp.]
MTEIFSKKRDDRLDFIRGLAMIGIVFIHVNSYFEYFHSSEDFPVIITLILSNLSRFSVPVFIFSAGYFSKAKDFKSYWSPKIFSILIPFLIFSFLGFFIKNNEWDFGSFIYQVFMGKSMTPYYFIPLLLQFYILYYICFKCFSIKYLWIASILALGINYLSNYGKITLISGDYEAISITNYVFFFFLGLIASNYKLDMLTDSLFKKYSIRTIYLIIASAIIYYSITENIHLKNHTLLYPIIAFIMLYEVNFREIVVKKIAVIGKESMGIFLIHPFLIHFMHSIDPYAWLLGPYGSIFVVAFLNVIIPLIIWISLRKIISTVYRP